jgi:hypothetical protein
MLLLLKCNSFHRDILVSIQYISFIAVFSHSNTVAFLQICEFFLPMTKVCFFVHGVFFLLRSLFYILLKYVSQITFFSKCQFPFITGFLLSGTFLFSLRMFYIYQFFFYSCYVLPLNHKWNSLFLILVAGEERETTNTNTSYFGDGRGLITKA